MKTFISLFNEGSYENPTLLIIQSILKLIFTNMIKSNIVYNKLKEVEVILTYENTQ